MIRHLSTKKKFGPIGTTRCLVGEFLDRVKFSAESGYSDDSDDSKINI